MPTRASSLINRVEISDFKLLENHCQAEKDCSRIFWEITVTGQFVLNFSSPVKINGTKYINSYSENFASPTLVRIDDMCVGSITYIYAKNCSGNMIDSFLDHVPSYVDITNGVTGTIPTLPSSLTQLTLYNNQLTGTIPSLPNSLTYLYLNTNQLTGSIPALPNSLTQLNLSNNQLTGTIPTLPSSLTQLFLVSNQLTGSIPSLPNALTFLNLSNNQLTGSIPALPSSLTYLSLYSNSFLQSAIDAVLCDADANCPSINNINLSGGNNEAPSSTGEACIDSLRAKGCTVTVYGGY